MKRHLGYFGQTNVVENILKPFYGDTNQKVLLVLRTVTHKTPYLNKFNSRQFENLKIIKQALRKWKFI